MSARKSKAGATRARNAKEELEQLIKENKSHLQAPKNAEKEMVLDVDEGRDLTDIENGNGEAEIFEAASEDIPHEDIPFTDPRLTRLEREFSDEQEEMDSDNVRTAVRLGRILLQVIALVDKRVWSWALKLGITRSVAQRYILLAKLDEDHPELVKAWSSLGIMKLYYVSRMPHELRLVLLKKRDRTELFRLNDADFRARIDELTPDSDHNEDHRPVRIQPSRMASTFKSSHKSLAVLRTYLREAEEPIIPELLLEAFAELKNEVDALAAMLYTN